MNLQPVPTGPRLAFSLVEFFVVLGIIALTLGLLMPAVQKARESANRAVCANNLRQVAMAVHSYVAGVGSRMPYNVMEYPNGVPPGADDPYWTWETQRGLKNWSWLARILPHLEQDNLYRECKIRSRTLGQSMDCIGTPVRIFFCPSDRAKRLGATEDRGDLEGVAVGLTNYKGDSGTNWCGHWGGGNPWHGEFEGDCDGLDHGNGVFYRSDYRRRLRISHTGGSHAPLVGEDVPTKNRWCNWPYANGASGTRAIPLNVRKEDGSEYSPDEWWNVRGFRSQHPRGANFAYSDGRVQFITNSIEPQIYRDREVGGIDTVYIP